VIALWVDAPTSGKGAAQNANKNSGSATASVTRKVSLSLQDRLEIHELFARYSQDLDMATDSVLGQDNLITNVFAPNAMHRRLRRRREDAYLCHRL
jgi:hypothetical protein